MKVAIMQPYFFPYIGYFQLMNLADKFVVYDNIEYAKKGWVNRNRILVDGRDEYITLPLKKDSDYLDVRDRFLADTWDQNKKKLLNRITESYRKAPCFKNAFPVIEECIHFEKNNLFDFIFNSLQKTNEYLEITTPIVVSSDILIDQSVKAEQKVISICRALGATVYYNPIGGLELYSKQMFNENGIDLNFIRSNDIVYQQYSKDFIPWLSIIDLMMFSPKEKIRKYLQEEFTII